MSTANIIKSSYVFNLLQLVNETNSNEQKWNVKFVSILKSITHSNFNETKLCQLLALYKPFLN